MSRPLMLVAACLMAASCASDPGAGDRAAPARHTQSGTHDDDTRGPAAPSVNSGDGTPTVGTGIRPSDSGLGLMPGFPVGK